MPLVSRVISFTRNLLHKSERDTDLDAEIRSQLELLIDQKIKEGQPPDEALRAAKIELGGVDQLKERVRAVRTGAWLDSLLQDIRFALRMLRKNPGFTTVAVLTLALGIGANTAIFSIVDTVLLQALPFRDGSRLAVMNETTPKVGTVSVSYPDFLDWRAESHSFSEMAGVTKGDFNLARISLPENISGDAVSTNFLSLLGIRPILGRDFEASENKSGTAPVVMLNFSLWQSHFGGDPSVVGRTITLDGHEFVVVGVLPSNFHWIDNADVLMPLGVWLTGNDEAAKRAERGDLIVVGRLATGVTLEQAQGEMNGIAAQLSKEYPDSNNRFGALVTPMRNELVGDTRLPILVLWGAAIFVLLIACSNVANLCLVRGAGRAREIALRMAVGASRGRILRQALVEGAILASIGGWAGMVVAEVNIQTISKLILPRAFSGDRATLNGTALLFCGVLAVFSTLIFGLAPAFHSTRTDSSAALKQGGPTAGTSVGQNRLRAALVVTEMSLSLVLMAGGGLLLKSLWRLMAVNPGFRPDRVLTMKMDLRTQQYSSDRAVLNFWQRTLDGVRALPGTESAAVGTVVPLTHDHTRTDITVEGMAQAAPGNYPHPDAHVVSSGYVETMGISLLRGRTITDGDRSGAPSVGLVNDQLARRFFPDGDAIGKRFEFGHLRGKSGWITIVGVVRDTKLYGLGNPARLEVYVPLPDHVSEQMTLIVRSKVDPGAMTSAIRGVVRSIDADQPIFDISTMNELEAESVSTQRTTLILLGTFGGLALILAAIGIYGVLSYSVAQKTREIGIRLALGAFPADVSRMVLIHGAKIAAVSVAVGLSASMGLTRLMSSLLYSVSTNDPGTLIAAAAILTLVALAACYIPARRAMRVDPMVALRHE